MTKSKNRGEGKMEKKETERSRGQSSSPFRGVDELENNAANTRPECRLDKDRVRKGRAKKRGEAVRGEKSRTSGGGANGWEERRRI